MRHGSALGSTNSALMNAESCAAAPASIGFGRTQNISTIGVPSQFPMALSVDPWLKKTVHRGWNGGEAAGLVWRERNT